LKGVNANSRLFNGNLVYSQRNNAVIYAKAGETVNISCSFDPSLIVANNNKLRNPSSSINSDSDAHSYNYKNKRKKRRRRKRRQSKKRRENPQTNKRDQTFSGSYSYNSNQRGLSGGVDSKPGGLVDHFDYTIEENDFPSMQLKNQNNFQEANNFDDESTSIFTFNDENNNNNYEKIFGGIDNKYEIDWYFLDRKGQMNIIRHDIKLLLLLLLFVVIILHYHLLFIIIFFVCLKLW
jgi:hypothetical protein